MHKKDHGNHLLFSNPTLVADLVRHFVEVSGESFRKRQQAKKAEAK